MEDLDNALRRELGLGYDATSLSELEAAQALYPDLLFEENDGQVMQVVVAVADETRLGYVSVEDARASDIDVLVDDELLFPIGARRGYERDPMGKALVERGAVLQAQIRGQYQAFLELVRSQQPRHVRPRPMPWPAGRLCDLESYGWTTLMVGRSIVLSELGDDRLERARTVLEAASERLGTPLGGIRLDLEGTWHFGLYLFGWSCEEPLGPWSPLGWRTVLEEAQVALDADLWDSLRQALSDSATWREPDVSLLLGSSRGAALAQGRLERAPPLGDPAWAQGAKDGDLILMANHTIAAPRPFVLRGRVVTMAKPETTTVVDPAMLDETERVYLLPGAVHPHVREDGMAADALDAHQATGSPEPPWIYTPPLPAAVEAAQALLRERQRLATEQEKTGMLGKRPSRLECLEAMVAIRNHLEPDLADPYNPPATEQDIERISAIGSAPEVLVELYRWHDGCHDGPGASDLFSRAWFCRIETGLLLREIGLERGDFQPSWHVIGENGSGDVLVIELAPGPNYGRLAFWDHEMDNTGLEFEKRLEDELVGIFDFLSELELPEHARWLPTGLGSPPQRILPEALRWTDTSKLRPGTTLVTSRGETHRAWLWWPHGHARWLHGRTSRTAEGAVAELCRSMRAGPVSQVNGKGHDSMVGQLLAPGHKEVLLCSPRFELAPGA